MTRLGTHSLRGKSKQADNDDGAAADGAAADDDDGAAAAEDDGDGDGNDVDNGDDGGDGDDEVAYVNIDTDDSSDNSDSSPELVIDDPGYDPRAAVHVGDFVFCFVNDDDYISLGRVITRDDDSDTLGVKWWLRDKTDSAAYNVSRADSEPEEVDRFAVCRNLDENLHYNIISTKRIVLTPEGSDVLEQLFTTYKVNDRDDAVTGAGKSARQIDAENARRKREKEKSQYLKRVKKGSKHNK